jgi:protein-S-isoprenylcysteine O-methyltransferase Ste14
MSYNLYEKNVFLGRRQKMFVATIVACSVIIGGTCALQVLTLSDSTRVVVLGLVLLVIAAWTHRFFKREGRSEGSTVEVAPKKKPRATNDHLQ